MVQVDENELSARQESDLASLNYAALAASRGFIACTRYALFTALRVAVRTLTASPRAAASEIDAFRAG